MRIFRFYNIFTKGFKNTLPVTISFIILFVSLMPQVHAQSGSVFRCRNAIDSAFQSYIYGTLPEDTSDKKFESEDIGFLNKLTSLYSTEVPTSELIDEAITYLREVHDNMESVCAVFRNPQSSNDLGVVIPATIGLQFRISACSETTFESEESLNLSLYCDNRMSFYMDFLKDHIRSVTLRSSQQKQATILVKKYQELNKKLRKLSENIIRMVQFIGKFNSALGPIITGKCQQ